MSFFSDLTSGAKNTVKTVGSFIPGIGDAYGAEQANQQNAANSAQQMAFQERMSNSAYQRAMEDMGKAGLNPMLAMTQGGASTPSGSMATANPVTRTKLAESLMNASATRNQASLAENTLVDSEQNRTLQSSQTAKNIADTQATEIQNRRNKKYGPIDDAASNVIKGIMEKLDTSAKETKTRLNYKNVLRSNPKPVESNLPFIRRPQHN